MCLAIPGKVIKIEGRKAEVEYSGVKNQAMVGEENVKIGDMVMVQMGIIVRKLTKIQAEKMLEGWE